MAYVIVYLAIALIIIVALYVGGPEVSLVHKDHRWDWSGITLCIGLGMLWPLTTIGVLFGIFLKGRSR